MSGFTHELLEAIRKLPGGGRLSLGRTRWHRREARRQIRRTYLQEISEKYIPRFQAQLQEEIIREVERGVFELAVRDIVVRFSKELDVRDRKEFWKVWSMVVRGSVYRLHILNLKYCGELARQEPLRNWRVSWLEFAYRVTAGRDA